MLRIDSGRHSHSSYPSPQCLWTPWKFSCCLLHVWTDAKNISRGGGGARALACVIGTEEEWKPSMVLKDVIGCWDVAPLHSQQTFRKKWIWDKCGPRWADIHTHTLTHMHTNTHEMHVSCSTAVNGMQNHSILNRRHSKKVKDLTSASLSLPVC